MREVEKEEREGESKGAGRREERGMQGGTVNNSPFQPESSKGEGKRRVPYLETQLKYMSSGVYSVDGKGGENMRGANQTKDPTSRRRMIRSEMFSSHVEACSHCIPWLHEAACWNCDANLWNRLKRSYRSGDAGGTPAARERAPDSCIPATCSRHWTHGGLVRNGSRVR